MKKIIIGVMGPGRGATDTDIKNATQLGKLIAENGWILLSGGRKEGVMGAVNKGAKEKSGITIGILPSDDPTTFSNELDIPIITNMRSARNYINVLSSNIVIACGMESGTASEVALAIKSNKQVILLNTGNKSEEFHKSIGKEYVHIANNPMDTIEIVKKILNKSV